MADPSVFAPTGAVTYPTNGYESKCDTERWYRHQSLCNCLILPRMRFLFHNQRRTIHCSMHKSLHHKHSTPHHSVHSRAGENCGYRFIDCHHFAVLLHHSAQFRVHCDNKHREMSRHVSLSPCLSIISFNA